MADARLWDRPLSPHLQISRWTSAMAVSIMHRITGGALYVGTILLAFWLLSMASGPAAYDRAAWFFGSIIGHLILLADTLILVQHLVSGTRALIWVSATAWSQARAWLWPARPRSPLRSSPTWIVALIAC